MSNFDFFEDKYEALSYFGQAAEENVYSFPSQSVTAIRAFAEELAKTILALELVKEPKSYFTQEKRIRLIQKEVEIVPRDIINSFHTIRKAGNKSSHSATHALQVTETDAMKYLKLAFTVGRWFNDVYIYPPFEISDFTEPQREENIKEELKNLQSEYEEVKKNYAVILERLNSGFITNEERRDRRKRSLERHYPEKDARILIDQQLNDSGWEADTNFYNYKSKKTMPEDGRKMAIAEWPTNIGYVDYALFIGRRLVGFVEAKSKYENVQGVLQGQTKDYAKNVKDISGVVFEKIDTEYGVPFLYATNGRAYNELIDSYSGIWFFDARYKNSISYPNNGWHSPKELEDKLNKNKEKADKLLKENPVEKYFLRDYQEKAVNAVEKSLMNNQRRMLLSMATGTGKTRTALTLAYRLLEAERFNRILYVVDRRNLGQQTKDSADALTFHDLSFNATYTIQTVEEGGELDSNARLRIATIQGLLGMLKDGTLGTVGQYDFIIVDEAHRGYRLDGEIPEDLQEFDSEEDYQSQYKKVLDYFDAPVLALTATPTRDTVKIFNDPIFEYSYSEAVIDDVLVDHDVPVRLNTKLSREGIHFDKSQYAEFLNRKTGEIEKRILPDELNFDVKKFNDQVINEEFNKEIAKQISDYILLEDPGKTLIFAKTDAHADSMVNLLRKAYKENGDLVCDEDIVKLTGKVKAHNDKIKEFRNEEKPRIAVTVDLLSTGVDVEDIVNIVFVRAIRSRVLYEQMLGRATRKSHNFPKNKFFIYDAVGIYDALNDFTNMPPTVTKPKKNLNQLFNDTIAATTKEGYESSKTNLIVKLNAKLKFLSEMQDKEISELLSVDDVGKWVRNFKNMNQSELWNYQDDLQELIYYLVQNVDSSGGVIISKDKDTRKTTTRGYGEGNENPQEYMQSFEEFVKSNSKVKPALDMAINSPGLLTKRTFKEVTMFLRKAHFTTTQLNAAYKDIYKVEMESDIISYLRYVALGNKVESTEVRVKRMMASIKGKKSWNRRQLKWLDLIENQLIANVILGPSAKDSLNSQFFKEEVGGLTVAKRVFDKENIDELVKEINSLLYMD